MEILLHITNSSSYKLSAWIHWTPQRLRMLSELKIKSTWLRCWCKGRMVATVFQQYLQQIELFMCSCLGKGVRDIQEITRDPLHGQRWNIMHSVLKVPQVYASSLHGLLSHSYVACHLPFPQSFGLKINFLTPFLQIIFLMSIFK